MFASLFASAPYKQELSTEIQTRIQETLRVRYGSSEERWKNVSISVGIMSETEATYTHYFKYIYISREQIDIEHEVRRRYDAKWGGQVQDTELKILYDPNKVNAWLKTSTVGKYIENAVFSMFR